MRYLPFNFVLGLSITMAFSLFLSLGYCQSNTVNGKKFFQCTDGENGGKVDSFPTPDGAIDHYITKHMPYGFKLKPGTIEVLDNGWVVFVTNKNGEQEASQGGHVLGHIICPPDSWVPYEGSFASKKCHCNQGLVAYGDSCKRPEDIPADTTAETPEDECAKRNPLTEKQKVIKDNVVKKVKEIVDRENELLSKDLSRARQVGVSVILKKGELNNYGKMFYAGYGQALERLTALAVAQDPDLNRLLEHIPNELQKNTKGGAPDFIGRGKLPKTFEIDITTPKEVEKKKLKDNKKCYEYITYDRLTDKQGIPFEE
jgi:hypothetical protein